MDKGTIRTRVSVEIVAGPILISTGIAWALEDRWHVTWFVLMPMLLVLLGGADAYRPSSEHPGAASASNLDLGR
jgi:hypothetical protein